MENWFDTVAETLSRRDLERKEKAKNMFSGLQLYGGAPTEQQALDLKSLLGVEVPRVRPEGVRNISNLFDSALSPTSMAASAVGAPTRVRTPPEYASLVGSNDVKLLEIDAKRRELKHPATSLTNVIGAIAQKMGAGQELTPGEQEVYDKYYTSKTPWSIGELGEEEAMGAARVAAGLKANANVEAQIGMDQKKLAEKTQFDQGLLQVYKDKEAGLTDRFNKGLISLTSYRNAVLGLAKKKEAVRDTVLTSILNGSGVPNLNIERLMDVDVNGDGVITGSTKAASAGVGQIPDKVGNLTKDKGIAIITHVTSKPAEQQQEALKKLLEGYGPDERQYLFNIYQAKMGK